MKKLATIRYIANKTDLQQFAESHCNLQTPQIVDLVRQASILKALTNSRLAFKMNK